MGNSKGVAEIRILIAEVTTRVHGSVQGLQIFQQSENSIGVLIPF